MVDESLPFISSISITVMIFKTRLQLLPAIRSMTDMNLIINSFYNFWTCYNVFAYTFMISFCFFSTLGKRLSIKKRENIIKHLEEQDFVGNFQFHGAAVLIRFVQSFLEPAWVKD